MSVLTYGSYQHPTPPVIRVERTVRRNIDDSGRVERIVWKLDGELIGTSHADLLSKISALEAAFRPAGTGTDDLVLKDGAGTVLMQLDASAAVHGLEINGPHYPEGGGVELDTIRRYSISVAGEFLTAGTAYDEDSKLLYEYDANGLSVLTASGSLKTKRGTSASAVFASKDPALAGNFSLVKKGYVRDGLEDTSIQWQYQYRESKAALPVGVSLAEVTSARRLAPDGSSVLYTINGHLEGSNPAAGVAAYRRNDVLLSEQIATSQITGAVDFSLEYLSLTESRDIVSWVETITIREGGMDWRYVPVFGGQPRRIETVQLPAQATQSGSVIWRKTPPTTIPLKFPRANLKPGGVRSRRGGQRTADGSHINYSLEYSYEFEFPATPAMPVPSVA